MPDVRQRVTFESCIFENIQYGPTDVPAASEVDPDLAALIVATNSRNSVVVRGEVLSVCAIVGCERPVYAYLHIRRTHLFLFQRLCLSQ